MKIIIYEVPGDYSIVFGRKFPFEEIDLTDVFKRTKYVQNARKRLEELEKGRLGLVKILKENFEPHHLI